MIGGFISPFSLANEFTQCYPWLFPRERNRNNRRQCLIGGFWNNKSMDTDEKAYVEEFLTTSASPELMDIFNRAVDRAEAANSRTYLAHVIDLLLDDSTIRSRIPEKVRIKSHAALAEQTLKLTDYGNGSFAFRFAPLIEPARQLARDWGAE